MNEDFGFGSPNQLGNFSGRMKVKVYFLRKYVNHMWISSKENLGRGDHHSSRSMVEQE